MNYRHKPLHGGGRDLLNHQVGKGDRPRTIQDENYRRNFEETNLGLVEPDGFTAVHPGKKVKRYG